jgi:release factor glutamine methyltransferase
MRIADCLLAARQLGVARLDALALLSQHLGQPRTWLLAHDDAPLGAAQPPLQAALERRAAGEPLAYIIGEREFHGLMLHVTPAVLVPRPETETLVDWALQVMANFPAGDAVDLGTGSGAIALALKHRAPSWHLTATDASAAALAIAQGNATRLGLPLQFVHGDWWQPLAGRRFGLVVSNPPYIAGQDPHLAALTHEPLAALTPGGDGLDALRALITDAPSHLLPGAWLLLEHGYDQAAVVSELLRQQGFEQINTRADLAELPRCTGGRWPTQEPSSALRLHQ